jgi:hypothetical protein
MSKMTREEKLFKKENATLEYYKEQLINLDCPIDAQRSLRKLTMSYEALLNQTRFMTWVSGRLERKLHRKNVELLDKNDILQRTLNDLTVAEAGKSAYAIIYFIAIILFMLEELLIEPLVSGIGYGILIKLGIVLILKVSEGFIEKKLVRHKRLLRKKGVDATP